MDGRYAKQTFIGAFKRLWKFATCMHTDTSVVLDVGGNWEMKVCRRCGRIIYCTYKSPSFSGIQPESRYKDQLDYERRD